MFVNLVFTVDSLGQYWSTAMLLFTYRARTAHNSTGTVFFNEINGRCTVQQ